METYCYSLIDTKHKLFDTDSLRTELACKKEQQTVANADSLFVLGIWKAVIVHIIYNWPSQTRDCGRQSLPTDMKWHICMMESYTAFLRMLPFFLFPPFILLFILAMTSPCSLSLAIPNIKKGSNTLKSVWPHFQKHVQKPHVWKKKWYCCPFKTFLPTFCIACHFYKIILMAVAFP